MKSKHFVISIFAVVIVVAGAANQIRTTSSESAPAQSVHASEVLGSTGTKDSAAQRLRHFGNRMRAAFTGSLDGQDDSESDASASLVNLKRAVEVAKARPIGDLQEQLQSLNRRIQDEHWIDRANSGALTPDEQEVLRKMFEEQSTLSLALIQQKLANVEKEYL